MKLKKTHTDMRYLLLIPLALMIACTPKPDGEIGELESKRDSLQAVQQEIELEIIQLNKTISLLDTNVTKDELKLIKQIAMLKSGAVKRGKKLKELENELESLHKEKNLVAVEVKKIKGETFKHYVTVFGRVEALNYAQISPEMGGQIRTIHVKAGQQVSKGQLLVSLNTDAVGSSIKATEVSLELARTTFEKQEKLWKQGIGSEIQFLSSKSTKETLEAQLKAQKAQLQMSQIRAPFNGYVDKIFQKEGALASAMFPVIEVVNINKLQIKADVSEKYIDKVKKGHQVELTFSTLSDTLNAEIIRTSNVINNSSRTFEIEVQINNKDRRIKPNMVSAIKINDFSTTDAIVVPSTVIRKDIISNKDYVYVIIEKDGEMIAEKRMIKTSPYSYDDETLLKEGLQIGDKVVTEGFHLISSGVSVKVKG